MKSEKKQRPLWKTILIFALVLLGCLVLGYFVGVGMAMARNLGWLSHSSSASLPTVMVSVVIAAFGVLWLVCLVVCGILYYQAKKQITAWDGESEEPPEKADRLLSYYFILTNGLMLLSWFLFALYVWAGETSEVVDPGIYFSFLFALSGLLLPFLQRAAVQLVKKVDPAKQGEVLDFHFHKQWMDGLDEMEKVMTYKAGYAAFRAVYSTCMVLWLVCIIGELAFSWGLAPVCVVSLLWFVSTMTFQIEAFRLEHKKGK